MSSERRKPRVVLVHDWLCGYRGGEAVLERLIRISEQYLDPVELLVMFDDGRSVAPSIDSMKHFVSRLGRVPGASGSMRRWLLPLYPMAVRSLSRHLERMHRRTPIDMVISSSSAAVKGVEAPDGVPHICYCHSPARYLWGRGDAYGNGGAAGSARSLGLKVFGSSLRNWDRRTAVNVSRFIANSSFTTSELRRCYARDGVVVHPPVRTEFFTPSPTIRREDFWLVAGALEPYKRVDLAIDAAAAAGRRLIVAGSGSQEAWLRKKATSNVEFLGRVTDERLRDLFRRAELLLFPPIEDFGIIPVEAQACGLPVVARRVGGALDSVIPNVTGTFFDEPTPEAVAAAAKVIPKDADLKCRRNAERFSEETFDAGILDQIEEMIGRVR